MDLDMFIICILMSLYIDSFENSLAIWMYINLSYALISQFYFVLIKEIIWNLKRYLGRIFTALLFVTTSELTKKPNGGGMANETMIY